MFSIADDEDWSQPLDLAALVGQPEFGDRPEIGLRINPLLLAARREPTLIPSVRGVP